LFFLNNELALTLPEEAKRRPSSWLRAQLSLIAPSLLAYDGSYRSFGSYWWIIKRLLKEGRYGRRAWFQGSYIDHEADKQTDHGSTVLNLWAAVHYREIHGYDTHSIEELHICEWMDGSVSLYKPSDPDAGFQLDLFDSVRKHEESTKRFLLQPEVFLSRPWRERGEKALENQEWLRAIVCFKRSLSGSGSSADHDDAWLFLGQAFTGLGHFHKSYFCFNTLYQRTHEPWVLGLMASSLLDSGDIRKANELYAQAVKLSPGNPEISSGYDHARKLLAQMQTPETFQLIAPSTRTAWAS